MNVGGSPPKRRKRQITASHFHCYLLSSLDPSHPYKTYIGFTTDPHRRLRQHNGILKAGGAWRTKKSGRPWQFVCIVHGFRNQKAALQFEWAWQNCHKSLAVRGAIGDVEARKLKRKRGVCGKLSILKAMVTECQDVYDRGKNKDDNTDLKVYFFDEKRKDSFEKVKLASGIDLPEQVSYEVIESVEAMPFWRDRGNKKKPSVSDEADEAVVSSDCMLCSRAIKDGEASVVCNQCQRQVHEICNDLHAEEGDGLCPNCDALLDCSASFTTEESDDEISLDDSEAESSEAEVVIAELSYLSIDEGTPSKKAPKGDQQMGGLVDQLVEPPTITKVSRNEDDSVDSFDQLISSTRSSKKKPKQPPPQSEIICLSDSSMDVSPVKLPRNQPSEDDDVIDLCSP